MTDLSNATIPQLWLRVWRIRLARWALIVCRNAADFSEWVMPETGNCSAVDKLVQSPDKLAIDDIAEISLP